MITHFLYKSCADHLLYQFRTNQLKSNGKSQQKIKYRKIRLRRALETNKCVEIKNIGRRLQINSQIETLLPYKETKSCRRRLIFSSILWGVGGGRSCTQCHGGRIGLEKMINAHRP